MSDMRLIVAGAGGRMGRTLVKAIADTDGAILAGAVDAPGSAVIGRDAGDLAGLGPNGIKVTPDLAPLLAKADGLVDFTIPAATLALAEIVAQQGLVHVIGTTGLSAENEKLIAIAAQRSVIVKSGNMSLGVNLLAALRPRAATSIWRSARRADATARPGPARPATSDLRRCAAAPWWATTPWCSPARPSASSSRTRPRTA